MVLSHSNRKDDASTSSNIGIPVQSESLKGKSDLLELDQGSTADLKILFVKSKDTVNSLSFI